MFINDEAISENHGNNLIIARDFNAKLGTKLDEIKDDKTIISDNARKRIGMKENSRNETGKFSELNNYMKVLK